MKRFAFLLVFALAFTVTGAFAQNHGEIGVYADYVRLHNARDANLLGLGGRLAVNVHSAVQLEGEFSYDFERTFGAISTTGTTTTTVPSTVSLLHGLFGPKIQTGGGPVRLFGTIKGGFLNFRNAGGNAATTGNFTNQVSNIVNGDTNGVLYPGGGIEFFAGPIGLRLEAGDMIYFDNGANHNLRVTVGPQFRF
jgi:hypothetical protein